MHPDNTDVKCMKPKKYRQDIHVQERTSKKDPMHAKNFGLGLTWIPGLILCVLDLCHMKSKWQIEVEKTHWPHLDPLWHNTATQSGDRWAMWRFHQHMRHMWRFSNMRHPPKMANPHPWIPVQDQLNHFCRNYVWEMATKTMQTNHAISDGLIMLKKYDALRPSLFVIKSMWKLLYNQFHIHGWLSDF